MRPPIVDKAFETFTHAGTKYLLLPKDGGISVVSEHGNNMGAWQSKETFRAALKGQLPYPATTLGQVRITFQILTA
jgi:hypothetical protein